MARLTRDMEAAGVAELDAGPGDAVLAVGFGPGVGVAELVHRMETGTVAGIDPSASMVEQAHRRNRAAVAQGQVRLERATADHIPWEDASFHGVVAVNSAQLWEPLNESVREVVRVLAPGGHLVTVTHAWAIEKRAAVADWAATMSTLCAMNGLVRIEHRTATFRSGPGLLLRGTKPLDCNPMAP
jgi:ubiquinone/menaquinone biosynthesis C-methylase UbiE